MSEPNYNLLILAAVGVGALFVVQKAMPWWCERQYDLSGKTVLISRTMRLLQ